MTRLASWELWQDVPASPEDLYELTLIPMGSEHGRDRPQPHWDIVDMMLWRAYPTAGNFSARSRRRPNETFFAMAIRVYIEARRDYVVSTEHGHTEKTYLAGL